MKVRIALTVADFDQAVAPAPAATGPATFTADITGLQSFPEQYSPLVPLLTQSQWGWHSFPNRSACRGAGSESQPLAR